MLDLSRKHIWTACEDVAQVIHPIKSSFCCVPALMLSNCSHQASAAITKWDPAGAADEEEMNVGASSRPSGPSRRAEDADSMALLAVEVAITFLFKVHHTHLILLNFFQTSLMSCMPRTALPV